MGRQKVMMEGNSNYRGATSVAEILAMEDLGVAGILVMAGFKFVSYSLSYHIQFFFFCGFTIYNSICTVF